MMYYWRVSLGSVFSQTLFSELYYFFVIWVVDPNNEKAIKGLGKGSGRDRVTVTTVTLKNGYAVLRPSLQKGFPQ